jgi:predicted acetyltransferase
MNVTWKYAADSDLPLLAEWNHQLIRDEGHSNKMGVVELQERMSVWLNESYRAVMFYVDAAPIGYALFRSETELVYLRQLFIARPERRKGLGRIVVGILRVEIWPLGKRITVDVLTSNLGGVAFWRAVGYKDYSLMLELDSDAGPS